MNKLIILLFPLLLLSCREVNSVDFTYRPDFSKARIIPGYGVDGVILGDTPEQVKKILGEPDEKFRWDGGSDGGDGFYYADDYHSGIKILFSNDINNYSYTFVQSIIIDSSFKGKTKEGFGIGSSYTDIEKHFGQPKTRIIQDSGTAVINEGKEKYFDFYCINSREFSIYYDNKIIKNITISGYQKRDNQIFSCF